MHHENVYVIVQCIVKVQWWAFHKKLRIFLKNLKILKHTNILYALVVMQTPSMKLLIGLNGCQVNKIKKINKQQQKITNTRNQYNF